MFAQKEEESKALVEKSQELEAKCKELVQTNEKNLQDVENYKTQNSQMSEQLSKQIQSTKEII